MKQTYPMVPVPQALKRVLTCTASSLSTLPDNQRFANETVPLFPNKGAMDLPSPIVGRIAAETIVAPSPGYPPYNASIMDGYAVSTKDFNLATSSSSQRFQCKRRIYAGPQDCQELNGNADRDINTIPHSSYVTTGAVIPSCYDAVVPLEQVQVMPDEDIEISRDVLKGMIPNKWIRPIGCDIPPGEVILEEGDIIEAAHVGLLLQCSVKELKVRCLPKVCNFMTKRSRSFNSILYYRIGTHNMNYSTGCPTINRE